MRHLKPDFGISGEGEVAFTQFLAQFETGAADYSGLASFYWFEGGELKTQLRASSFTDLEVLKLPDFSLADPRYFSQVGTVNVQTKRGCPLKCTYCTYPTIEGAAKRMRSRK